MIAPGTGIQQHGRWRYTSLVESTISTAPQPRFAFRPRHLGWLALATVLIGTAALAVHFWAFIWIPYVAEQQVISHIQALGGSVQMSAGGWNWVRRVIGNEPMTVFDRVWTVELAVAGSRVTDADMPEIAKLRHVVSVNLAGTKISGNSIVYLNDCQFLQQLIIPGTEVTDAGIAGLNHLYLVDLLLTGLPIGDAALERLDRFEYLEGLDLGATHVTDDGLCHLARIKRLSSLSLNGARISDAGLVHLKGIATLRHLDLGATNVTDEGVADLRRCLPSLTVER